MWHKRDDMIVHETDPYNAEPPRSALHDPITAPDSFYVRNHGPVPEDDPGDWAVTVDGLVDGPASFTLDRLREEFTHHTLTATMQCAGNRRAGFLPVRDIPGEDPWGPGATSTAQWTGARLCDVLRSVGVVDRARHVEFTDPDVSELAEPPQAYGGSIPLAKALSSEVLLAWAMNGEPLPAVHGAPVRVVVPGYVGRAASSGCAGSRCARTRPRTTSRPRPIASCRPRLTRTERGRGTASVWDPSR